MNEEITRIGYTDDGYEVYIVTDDEEDIPHFHYRKVSKENYGFHTCIKLDSVEYLHHTGKEEILNTKQKKNLIKLLTQTDPDNSNQTNWIYLIKQWNRNNLNVKVNEDLEMPDYNNLK